MKKKILYVIALILLCSAGCSNAQEKDHPNKETVKDKVTVTNQTKEDKTTQQEKEETKMRITMIQRKKNSHHQLSNNLHLIQKIFP